MKNKYTSSLITLAVLAAFSTPSYSEDTSPLSAYVGGNFGRSYAKIDDPRITKSLLASGFSSLTIADDNRSIGYKIFWGYQMTHNFALEGGYFDLGEFGYHATTAPVGTLDGELRARGLNLDLVGTLPLTDRFSVFARGGVTYVQTRDTFSGTGAVIVNNPSPRANGGNFKAGIGMQYAFTDNLAMRVEYERYHLKDGVGNRGDIDTATVGLIYRFGAPSPSSMPIVAAPPILLPMPAPLPAPAPVPVAQKVTLSADSLFDFDKSEVKVEGKTHLNSLVEKMRGLDVEVVVAVGHTDSVGSSAYNQKLSVRRANAVKAYLVSQGIDAARVYTEGRGKTQPIADNASATGRAKNRRVEVEVVGTSVK